MIVIDVIKILENYDIFCVIITRFDTSDIRTRATLAVSREWAETYVTERKEAFEKAKRKVRIRWHQTKEVKENAL